MTVLRFGSALSAGLLVSAISAQAEMTADGALDRYLGLIDSMGMNVSVGDKTVSGGTHRWSNIVLTDDEDTSQVTIDWIEAREDGDNRVRLNFGPNTEIRSTVELENAFGEDEGEYSQIIDLTFDAYQAFVTEDGDTLEIAYSAARIGVLSRDTGSDDTPFTIDMAIENITGAYASTDAGGISGNLAAGLTAINYYITSNEMDSVSETSSESMTVDFSFDAVDPETLSGYLDGTYSMFARYAIGRTESRSEIGGGDQQTMISSVTESMSGEIDVSDRRFVFASEADGLSYSVVSNALPMPPIDAKLANAKFAADFEVGNPGEVTPMGLTMSITDLEVNESLWGMIDPAGNIPRDPAQLNLDIGADAIWTVDVRDGMPEDGEPPFIPQTVQLNDFSLSLAGASAEASGQGALSMQTGLPTGTARVEIRGVLGLVDTLAEMGLVPPAQAMMVRGMAPQFTIAGPEGEDHRIADIEALPDGSVTVNGQRVK